MEVVCDPGGGGGGADKGPLMGGGAQCRMLILRIGNVTCLCHLFSTMSHVEFKKKALSHITIFLPSCRMLLSHMSHVKFKKCRPVDFKDQGP